MTNFINELIHNPDFTFVDVRSEDEFTLGHLPGAVNIPILINEHRKLVGTCFKDKGQAAAISLGHELVDPLKETYLKKCIKALSTNSENNKYIHCWRGGLRSKMSQQWIQELGVQVSLVEGGYKFIRNHLLKTFEERYNLVVISGHTGTGKSLLLKKMCFKNIIDLEGYAKHRGSAFGNYHKSRQSSQQYFENQLALKLFKKQSVYAIEHESRFVGKSIVPTQLLEQINKSPQVVVTSLMEDRVQNIYQEYILNELICNNVEEIDSLKEKMITSLGMISKKLGGLLHKEIKKDMELSFLDFHNENKHFVWIEKLLIFYYDKLYSYSQKRHKKQVCIFKGNFIECEEFLQDYIDRRRTF
ncbi:MAG: tRNA 2-selenouridine(34) synthase MnmH [Bacteriovoracaceae bacterium]|jgi:tRNA 2-selenouridine synthase|nr:tRNA 2-selenouridine(34) synthase MnmH [Bacteriovoracaceae bacterium]